MRVDRLKTLSALDWILVAVLGLAVVLITRTVFLQGIGYDAAFEMEAFLAVNSIPSGVTLTEAYDLAPITSEFYGLLTFQIASILAGWFGITLSPAAFASYLIHHLVVAVLSVLGALAAGIGVGLALRNKTAGLFAAALIMVTPLWLGMGAMNYKDMPVAAGLSMVSCALIILGRPHRLTRKLLVAATALASVGIFVALGTRAGAMALAGALLLISIGIRGIQGLRSRNFAAFFRTAITGAAAVVFALFGLFVTNPFARINIVQWLQDSIDISRSYIWVGLIRTAGQDLPSNELPWWYAPIWLLAQLPILTSLAVSTGLVVILIVTLRGRVATLERSSIVQLSPLLVQGWVLPFLIIVSGAVLYDGIRHLSFALPGLLATAAITVAAITRPMGAASNPLTTLAKAGVVAAVVVIGASTFAIVRWFPYSYAFINPIAGAQKEPRAWELDYWGLTSREGFTRLQADGLDPVAVVPAPETGRVFGAVDGETANAAAVATGSPHGVYVFRRWDAIFRQDWCTRTFTIQRDGQILGEGGTCP